MITDFSKDVSKPEYDRRHNGHVYSVTERVLGIAADGDAFRYVTDDDPDFKDCDFVVKAYVCFDSKKRSDDEQELKATLMDKVNELNGRSSTMPRKLSPRRPPGCPNTLITSLTPKEE